MQLCELESPDLDRRLAQRPAVWEAALAHLVR
jgi:hypothetical protein